MRVERHATIDVLRDADLAGLATSCGGRLSRGRLRQLEADSRWDCAYLACRADAADTAYVAVLPVYKPRKSITLDAAYDVRALFESVGIAAPFPWMLLGGRSEYACGLLRSPQLLDEHLLALRDALSSFGGVPVALYANERELPFLRRIMGGGRAFEISSECRIDVRLEHEYMESLSASSRSIVRRDVRRARARGVETSVVAWNDVLEHVVPGIQRLKERHGRPDHPALISARLKDWLENEEVETIAFVAQADSACAICLGWRWREVLELYEISMPDSLDPVLRHLLYVESILYSPLRYAAAHGCTEMTLGRGSTRPKTLRGAIEYPLYAIVGTDHEPRHE